MRIYGETAIANGLVIGNDASGKQIDRSIFRDVFVYRDGRWRAVNAQENRIASGKDDVSRSPTGIQPRAIIIRFAVGKIAFCRHQPTIFESTGSVR